MSINNSITITFQKSTLSADTVWVVFRQLPDETEDDDAITLSEAAETLDALFEIDSCDSESTESDTSDDDTDTYSFFDSFESYEEAMSAAILSVKDLCGDVYTDYSYKASLQIYRSHLDKPYKLYLSNGSVLSTKSNTEQVSVALEVSGNSVEVDFPIRNIVSSDMEIADYNTKTILFKKSIIGIVNVVYITSYDLVTIKVFGEDEERGSCECLLFYVGMAETVSVTPPDVDDEAVDAVNCVNEDDDEEDDDEDKETKTIDDDDVCYQRYIYTINCNCLPYTTKSTVDNIVEVGCDTPFSSPTPNGTYSNAQGTGTVVMTTLISCPEEETWEGQDADFYKEKCCTPPPDTMTLPTCQVRKAIDYGGRDITKGSDFYKNNALSNEDVVLVPISPKDGICGEIITKYIVPDMNCCDDESYEDVVAPDYDEEPVIADNSKRVFSFSGGIRPIEIHVSGSGFFLDEDGSKKSIKIENDSAVFYLYTKNACGSATITADDGCTSDSFQIRAADGQWILASGSDSYLWNLRWFPCTYGNTKYIHIIKTVWSGGGSYIVRCAEYDDGSYIKYWCWDREWWNNTATCTHPCPGQYPHEDGSNSNGEEKGNCYYTNIVCTYEWEC